MTAPLPKLQIVELLLQDAIRHEMKQFICSRCITFQFLDCEHSDFQVWVFLFKALVAYWVGQIYYSASSIEK